VAGQAGEVDGRGGVGMTHRRKVSEAEYRQRLLRCIWQGARMLGEDFDPRSLAPSRPGISGREGGTLSHCTVEELLRIAYGIKRAGARIWVPPVPEGVTLRMASPAQLEAIRDLLASQTYLRDPDSFFRSRLGVQDPHNPTFGEARAMLAFLHSRQRATA
jgi:hypothetical protein